MEICLRRALRVVACAVLSALFLASTAAAATPRNKAKAAAPHIPNGVKLTPAPKSDTGPPPAAGVPFPITHVAAHQTTRQLMELERHAPPRTAQPAEKEQNQVKTKRKENTKIEKKYRGKNK